MVCRAGVSMGNDVAGWWVRWATGARVSRVSHTRQGEYELVGMQDAGRLAENARSGFPSLKVVPVTHSSSFLMGPDAGRLTGRRASVILAPGLRSELASWAAAA